MEEITRSLPSQIIECVGLCKEIPKFRKPDCLIIVGMGGSGIAGDLFKAIYQRKIDIPIITHHHYGLPDYFTENSLIILVSYSGNTEEVLSTFKLAQRKRLAICAISSDGSLLRREIPAVKVPAGLPPRGALGYLLTPIPHIVWKARLIKNPKQEIIKAARALGRRFDVINRRAKKFARRLYNRFPFIYVSEPELYPIAYRWQCQFNENAKIPAHIAYLPEMNHNEIVGLEGLQKLLPKAVLIMLRDKKEKKRIKKRVSITTNILSDDFVDIVETPKMEGDVLVRYLSSIWLGDLTSVYLARLNKVDPASVHRIDRLKKEMQR